MRCILVTDIHGLPQSTILKGKPVTDQTDIFCLGELCGKPACVGDLLHDHLVNQNGFEIAAERLAASERVYDLAVGFSAGGTVLWKAAKNVVAYALLTTAGIFVFAGVSALLEEFSIVVASICPILCSSVLLILRAALHVKLLDQIQPTESAN